jgi:hypothetical protein
MSDQKEKRGDFAGDFSTLWGVQIPPSALVLNHILS